MLFPHPRERFPDLPSGPTLSYRDVVLLDLARHAAMKAPFDLDYIQSDTAELHGVLKCKADEMAAELESDSEPALDVLEPFALAWARDRAVERAATSSNGA